MAKTVRTTEFVRSQCVSGDKKNSNQFYILETKSSNYLHNFHICINDTYLLPRHFSSMEMCYYSPDTKRCTIVRKSVTSNYSGFFSSNVPTSICIILVVTGHYVHRMNVCHGNMLSYGTLWIIYRRTLHVVHQLWQHTYTKL